MLEVGTGSQLGDVRTALVNGQTGRIALGKPKKSKN